MMGKHEKQKSLFSYSVDLDKRVRKDHPLRKVAEVVDFSFVRDEVKEMYGANGNVSVDPEVILKLMFLLFWDDDRSERELMKILAERLDYLWFVGRASRHGEGVIVDIDPAGDVFVAPGSGGETVLIDVQDDELIADRKFNWS